MTVPAAIASPRRPIATAAATTKLPSTIQPVPDTDSSSPAENSTGYLSRRSDRISMIRPSAMNWENTEGSTRKKRLALNSPAKPIGICRL